MVLSHLILCQDRVELKDYFMPQKLITSLCISVGHLAYLKMGWHCWLKYNLWSILIIEVLFPAELLLIQSFFIQCLSISIFCSRSSVIQHGTLYRFNNHTLFIIIQITGNILKNGIKADVWEGHWACVPCEKVKSTIWAMI